MSGSCPTPTELAALVEGSLSDSALNSIGEHVGACSACEAVIMALERKSNPLIEFLRGDTSSGRFDCAADLTSVVTPRNGALDVTQVGKAEDMAGPSPTGPVPMIPGYEILGELGRGGIGVVYRAMRLRLRREVAIKMLRAGAAATPQELARFLIEAEMVARVTHPNIVQIHEIGQHGGVPFVVLEVVEGGTLADRMRGRRWSAEAAAELAEQLARAVQHAHRCGVVHRDLKPANVLMTADGIPKIADFGLAKPAYAEVGLTSTGAVLGTPLYMAPEQARGERRIGPAADVYALGVILYELLAGHPPFLGDSSLEVLHKVVDEPPPPLPRGKGGVPRDLATVCMRCLEKDPARRYDSAEALAEDLRRYRRREPIRARRVSEAEHVWLWVRRRPAIAALLATLALSLATGTVVSTYFGLSERQRKREAELARDDAATAKHASDLLAAELTFRAALRHAESGLVDKGMFGLLDALQLAPGDAGNFRRVIRANLSALGERLPMPRHVWPDKRGALLVGADGARFATLTADQRVQLWHTATGEPAGPPSIRLAVHGLLAVLADGRRAFVAEDEGGRLVARLRDLVTGTALGPALLGSRRGITPDERFVWAGDYSDPLDRRRIKIQFLDVVAGKVVGPPVDEDFRLLRGRDGRAILMTFPARDDGPPDPRAVVRFRDLLTGADLAHVEPDPAGGDNSVRFNGSAILTADLDGTVRWWDPATGKATRPAWRPDRALRRIAHRILTADARTLIVACTDNRLRWFEIDTGREGDMALTLPPDFKGEIDLSPDGLTVLATTTEGESRLWQVGGGSWLAAHPAHPAVAYIEMAADPTGRTVVLTSGGQSPFARLIDGATGAALGQPLEDVACKATFSADGSLLATCTLASQRYAPIARVWDAATGMPRTPPLPSRTYIHGLAFSPDQHTFAVGKIGGTALFDATSGKAGPVLPQTAPVASLLYSRDGRYLATGSRYGWTNLASCWQVWDMATHRAIGPPVATSDTPLFAFAPDDRTVLALEFDGGRLRRWNVEEATAPDAGIMLHSGRKITRAVFRADTARLLTGYANGTAQQWDTANGRPLGAPLMHPAPVSVLAFSPDGATLAVGGEDGTVVLWDAETALPLGPPLVHHFGVLDVRFQPDGASLRTVTVDGMVHTWPIAPPVPDDAERLVAWVRAATAAHLEGDRVVLDKPDAWRQARLRLAELWPEKTAALARPLDPADAHERLARQAEANGDHFAACWHLDRLIATAPTAALYLRRAAVHAKCARTGDASEDLRRAGELGTPKAMLPELRRHTYEARACQDWPEALFYLNHLATLTPDDWRPYLGRADVYAQLAMPAERLADCQRAVRHGAEPAVVRRLVEDYASQEQWKNAISLLTQGRRLSLNETYTLALLLIKAGDREGYRRLCRQAMGVANKLVNNPEQDPLNAALWVCALAPSAIADYAESIQLAERVLEKLPATSKKRAEVLNTLGALLYRAGRDNEARDRLQQAIDARDGRGAPADWIFLALTCHRLDLPQETRTWLDLLRHASAPTPESFWSRLELSVLGAEVERVVGMDPRKSDER